MIPPRGMGRLGRRLDKLVGAVADLQATHLDLLRRIEALEGFVVGSEARLDAHAADAGLHTGKPKGGA